MKKSLVMMLLFALLISTAGSSFVYASNNGLDTDYLYTEFLQNNGISTTIKYDDGGVQDLSTVLGSDDVVCICGADGAYCLFAFLVEDGTSVELVASGNTQLGVEIAGGAVQYCMLLNMDGYWKVVDSYVLEETDYGVAYDMDFIGLMTYSNKNIYSGTSDGEVVYYATVAPVGEPESGVVDYTELLEQILAEEQAQTEELVTIRDKQVDSYLQLQTLNGSLITIVAFLVLNFCWSCMRQWRKNILKMGV